MLQEQRFILYSDKGVDQDGLSEWCIFFKKHKLSYVLCNANDIVKGALKGGDCLIISGGADLPYCESLNGLGNDKILSFVQSGGVYFGVCAGAYYAHREIDWKNTTESIAGNRELSFFDGVASGPLKKPYNPNKNEGGVFVKVTYNDVNEIAYYIGGPVMAVDRYTKVLATFEYDSNEYPAIMCKDIGAGRVIGMSPHMEYSNAYLEKYTPPLCENRETLFYNIMQDLFS